MFLQQHHIPCIPNLKSISNPPPTKLLEITGVDWGLLRRRFMLQLPTSCANGPLKSSYNETLDLDHLLPHAG